MRRVAAAAAITEVIRLETFRHWPVEMLPNKAIRGDPDARLAPAGAENELAVSILAFTPKPVPAGRSIVEMLSRNLNQRHEAFDRRLHRMRPDVHASTLCHALLKGKHFRRFDRYILRFSQMKRPVERGTLTGKDLEPEKPDIIEFISRFAVRDLPRHPASTATAPAAQPGVAGDPARSWSVFLWVRRGEAAFYQQRCLRQ